MRPWARTRTAARRYALWVITITAAGCGQDEPPPASDRPNAPASAPVEPIRSTKPAQTRQARPIALPHIPTTQPTRTQPASRRVNDQPTTSQRVLRRAVTQPVVPLTPLRRATVGDWARYRMRDDQFMTLRVTATTETDVTIEVEIILGGRPLPLPATRRESRALNQPRELAHRDDATISVQSERIVVAGHVWHTRRLDASWIDEEIAYQRTTWIAEDAPVYGTIKMTQRADGEEVAAMELVEFGRDPAPP